MIDSYNAVRSKVYQKGRIGFRGVGCYRKSYNESSGKIEWIYGII